MTKCIRIVRSVDRISSLPDAVLHRILSFLPSKYAACTSILSTRWRYLFPFTHNLDFDMWDSDYDIQTSHFMNFVDRYIMLSNVAHIFKFRLNCHKNLDISRVNTWICAALMRNVRELDLCIPNGGQPGMLPCCVFTSSTLVVLKLEIDFSLIVPASVYLPCLNSLHLHSIEFPDDISTERLFSSCPALEDLIVTGCFMKDKQVFNLSSPTLKRLTVDGDWMLTLDAPRLIYLEFTGCCKVGSTLKNLHSLLEARMGLFDTDAGYALYGNMEPHLVLEVLKGINCVQSLYLSDLYGRDLHTISAELPLFENMTYLNLRYDEHYDWFMILKLLHFSPNLEELIYDGFLEVLDSHWDDEEEEEANNNLPSCLSHHLKLIEFMSICGSDEDPQYGLRCVEYIMKNAKVLETVRIHIKANESKHLDIATKLLMMPRLSKTCKVEICRTCDFVCTVIQ